MKELKSLSLCDICDKEIVIVGMPDCCNHPFCHKCLEDWWKKSRTCPLCRKDITWVKRIPIADQIIIKALGDHEELIMSQGFKKL